MSEKSKSDQRIEIPKKLPMVPLRDVVIFPYMVFPLLIGRDASMEAIEKAMMEEKLLFMVAQKDPNKEEPGRRDLYGVGTVVKVLQLLKLPNNVIKVLIEGVSRAKLRKINRRGGYLEAELEEYALEESNEPAVEAAARHVAALFRDYVNLNANIPDEILSSIEQIGRITMLADFVAAHVMQSVERKQQILSAKTLQKQLFELAQLLEAENEILQIEKKIDSQVKERISKTQKNFYLQEQMRIIRKELGEELEEEVGDLQDYREKIEAAKMPPQAEERALEELEKLRQIPLMSPESTVIRNYLDWMIAIPWHKKTRDKIDLEQASRILEEDHYGLRKPKERILEHLAVLKLVKKLRGQIICFVGPPGVGKTSLAKSVARALGRRFVRISLGGVRDEAEIRGHRRTYIGSMPGRIIQSMKRAGTINPVFLMDEIDKMSMDFRGDPSSALLEVLDPEQNVAFNDHYLDVDYDLSQVMFIMTANVRQNIPPALLDRMEVIRLPGYLPHEKQRIARNFLIPRQIREHGLRSDQVLFSPNAVAEIIDAYTMEAGVRNLERNIAKICRKIAFRQVRYNKQGLFRITRSNLASFLGPPRILHRELRREDTVGTAVGLAWTPVGGDILTIEVNIMSGKGVLQLTGHLGEVMKESAHAALSYLRSHAVQLGLKEDFNKNRDIHIHVPEGAIPKDGPSAGVALTTALYSAVSGLPVRHDVAMTGEVTIHGDVLPIGGLTEKSMAAERVGIRRVLIPAKNEKDLGEVPREIRGKLEFVLIKTVDAALENAIVGFRSANKKRRTVRRRRTEATTEKSPGRA